MTVSRPCYFGNLLLGVVGVDVNLAYILEDVTYYQDSLASYTFLIDNKGQSHRDRKCGVIRLLHFDSVCLSHKNLQHCLLIFDGRSLVCKTSKSVAKDTFAVYGCEDEDVYNMSASHLQRKFTAKDHERWEWG